MEICLEWWIYCSPYSLSLLQGSTYLYKAWVQPTLALHEQEIDLSIERARLALHQSSVEWGRKGISKIQTKVLDLITKVCIRYLSLGGIGREEENYAANWPVHLCLCGRKDYDFQFSGISS